MIIIIIVIVTTIVFIFVIAIVIIITTIIISYDIILFKHMEGAVAPENSPRAHGPIPFVNIVRPQWRWPTWRLVKSLGSSEENQSFTYQIYIDILQYVHKIRNLLTY